MIVQMSMPAESQKGIKPAPMLSSTVQSILFWALLTIRAMEHKARMIATIISAFLVVNFI
jgi:hypothetical protein